MKKGKDRYGYIGFQRLTNELQKEHEKRTAKSIYAEIRRIKGDAVYDGAEYDERCTELLMQGTDDRVFDVSNYLSFVKAARFSIAHLEIFIQELWGDLLLVNANIMQFHVHEDTWKIALFEDGSCKLMHNDYYRCMDGGRAFTGKFHEHRIIGRQTPASALETIMSYRGEMHG